MRLSVYGLYFAGPRVVLYHIPTTRKLQFRKKNTCTSSSIYILHHSQVHLIQSQCKKCRRLLDILVKIKQRHK